MTDICHSLPTGAGRPRVDADFHRLLEKLPAAAYTCDAEGLITYFNRHAATLWGREPKLNDPVDRFCGSFKLYAIDGTPIPHNRCWMALALNDGREYNGQEIIIDCPDGRRLVGLAHANPYFDDDGRVIGAVNVLVDITERRKLEESLRQSERDLRDFFDNAALGLHWVGPDGIILRANQAELDMLGYTREEYVGRHITEFHADPEAIAEILQRLTAGETLINFEARLRRKDGAIRHVLINSNVLWENGRFIHTRCFTRDITERKLAEEAIRESDRRKSEFLALLAHELRNPLAPIRNGLEVVRLAGSDRAATDQARAMMERQLAHMVRLIDDLLDLSRITKGKIDLRRERIDLAAAVRDAVEASRPLVLSAGHELVVKLPAGPVFVDADRTRLAQVFVNLLNNSARYTDRGGHIRIAVERQGSDAVVTVTDDGSGIAPDLLPRVFDMFTQADRSLERSQGGLGIGLNLVRGLVDLHGGSVYARSDGPGRGSTFTVRLPVLLGPPPADGDEERPQEPGHRAVHRILVVDDNEDGATSLGMMLEILGHDVRIAHDGQAAVDDAASFQPDVVLLDIGLPKMNGYDACRRIREQPGGSRIVLIAVTGWGQDDDRKKSKDAGFNFHLVKPVDPAALNKLLTGLLMTPA